MALIPSLSSSLSTSFSRTAAATLVSVSLLLACSSSDTGDGSQGGASAVTPATSKALPGAACTTNGECSNGSCYRVPDPPACSLALPSGSPRPGTCCIPAGSAPTNGDARSCCNGDIRDSLCCKGVGQWPAAAVECCTGKVDGNGYCTDPAPQGRPAGSPCVHDADCASGKCPNPCVDILSGGGFCE